MFLTTDELAMILEKEEQYMNKIRTAWGPNVLTEKSDYYLRMGKRTELLCELQFEKERAQRQPEERSATCTS